MDGMEAGALRRRGRVNDCYARMFCLPYGRLQFLKDGRAGSVLAF